MRVQKNYPKQLNLSDFSDKSLLILDDDDPLRGRLSRAMEKKGFVPKEAKTVAEGLQIVKNNPPSFAVVDLRLEDGSGIDLVKELSKINKDCRIIMLTGYGNLPTAVAAVKAGAAIKSPTLTITMDATLSKAGSTHVNKTYGLSCIN